MYIHNLLGIITDIFYIQKQKYHLRNIKQCNGRTLDILVFDNPD